MCPFFVDALVHYIKTYIICGMHQCIYKKEVHTQAFRMHFRLTWSPKPATGTRNPKPKPLDIFVSGSQDVLMRRLFQLTRCHLDLVLVSDKVGCLKNNLIDTSPAEKVTNKCKQSETRSKSTSRGRNKYHHSKCAPRFLNSRQVDLENLPSL